MRWISRPRREGTTSPRTTKVRTMGKYGSICRRQLRERHASQPRIFGLRRRIGRARTLRIVGDFRCELGQDDMQEPKVEGGRPAHRKGPVDELWALRRHDHVARAKEIGRAHV